MGRFSQLIGNTPAPVSAPAVEPVVEQEPVRARDDNGHFVADDPSTPENEAWVGGVSPKKTRKRTSKRK